MTKHPLSRATDVRADADRQSRAETLVAIADHCAAAKILADELGNKFLAYLLAMIIQEAFSNLRPHEEDVALELLIETAPRG